MASKEPLWGIDLGGTKIEGIVFESDPTHPIVRLRVPTEAHRGYDAILRKVADLVDLLSQKTGEVPRQIGIGHPGTLDPRNNQIKNSNTLCFNGQPLQQHLTELLQIPVQMANDANCFSLAEARWGAARGASVVFGVILGTGIGGGIVIDGKVHTGLQGIAGEWGHNVHDPGGPPCYCGKHGCVERLISGPALEEYYGEHSTQLLPLDRIVQAAAQGDVVARSTIDRLTRIFGEAISRVVNILDPHCIVLGGGLSNIEELYSTSVNVARAHVFNDRFDTPIVRNQLGDSAGVIGAAMLCS